MLTKYQILAIVAITGLSYWSIYTVCKMVDFDIVLLDMLFDITIFFSVPFVMINAFGPLVEWLRRY